MREWQPIETAPVGRRLLLWVHLEKRPDNSAAITGTLTAVQPDEFFVAVPTVLKHLSDDTPLSQWSIWDDHVYRPMQATHWMPLPPPPAVYTQTDQD